MNRPILLLVVLAIMAACSSSGDSGGSATSLDGHTYLSTRIEGADLVQGTRVRLAFVDGQLSANAGCNIMGGAYSIEGDRLTTTQLSMTEMACDEQRARQDEWLARFLSGGANINLDGDTLILTDGTINLTLLDEEVATPDQPLEGTLWVLEGIVSGDAVSSVPVGVIASIQITTGRLDLKAGCNQGGGSIELTPDQLTFGPIMLTKKACEAGPMAVETAVVTVLSGAIAYTIDADVLTLDAGDAGLIFRAAT